MKTHRMMATGLFSLLLLPSPGLAQDSPAKARRPLVDPGPAPAGAILFVGNLQGTIDPCT